MGKEGQQQITLDIGELEAVSKEIAAKDTEIQAATGSDAAVRKSIATKLAEDNAETVDNMVEQIVGALDQQPLEVLIGFQSKLTDALDDKFEAPIKEYLDAEVEKATKDSKSNVAELREARKVMVEKFRALKTILDTFGVDTSSVPEPKRSAGRSSGGGSSSKTGKNKEGYRYLIDGKERPDSQNTISSTVFYATEGCAGTPEKPEKWGTAKFKEFLAEQGVKWGEDDEWSVTLPNNKVVSARRFNDAELAKQKAEEDAASAKSSDADADDGDSTEATEAA